MAGLLDKDLSMMSHDELFRLRNSMTDKKTQNKLAPYEHRAFAREYAQRDPWKAAVSLPFAIPAYTAYKYAGFGNSRSDPSLEQIRQGYKGLLEGLLR